MSDTVIGSITITKVLTDAGKVAVNVDYEGLNPYEAIGLLLAELDTQRGNMRGDRG